MIFYHETFDEEVYSVKWWSTMTKGGLDNYTFLGQESAYENREEIEDNYE